ncbi:MAG: B12-binding domain-containing radical SAM protein [Verrucomicrobia bacterium]|nr:B12-binding domain-containing radical SAM protein [Verrucomicrobiota bacterium]
MKALLISPRNQYSFWTFAESCRLVGRKVLCPPAGLLTVAAMLPPDWQLRVVDLETRELTEADWNWADMVMITGMVVHRKSFKETVAEAKRRGKTVVAGGPYPTSMSEEVLAAGCDFLVRGEAENTLPALLEALKEGKTRGVFEHPEKPDVTTSPMPRFDLLRLEDYVVMTVQTSRGCPFDCEFCDVVNLYGRKPRFKTPEQVIAELESLYRLGHRGEVFISDDNFIGNKAHARALLAKLTPWNQARGEPFAYGTQASVNLGQDPEMIDLMTEANFGYVFVGIESPDEDVLAAAHKFHNIRNPLVESLGNITRNGLSVMGSFILGMDAEKPGAGERICSFVELTGLPLVMVNTLQVPPDTTLWKRLARENRRVVDHTSGETTVVPQLNYVPLRPEADILSDHRLAWDYLYEPSRFLARNYRYHLTIRPTRAASAKAEGRPSSRHTAGNRGSLDLHWRSLVAFLRLCWRQGIRSPCRVQYWRNFFGMLKRNPSRLRKYLTVCVQAEDMFRIRATMRQRMGAASEKHDSHARAAAASVQEAGSPQAKPVAQAAP